MRYTINQQGFDGMFLLFKMVTQWKNIVHLSPSLNRSALDVYLQLTSFKRVALSKSMIAFSFLNTQCSLFFQTIKNLQFFQKKLFMSLDIDKHLIL